MFRIHHTSRLIPMALAALLAVGCSELPTQPTVDSTAPMSSMNMRAGGADPAFTIIQPPPGDHPASGMNQARILGNRGGTVSYGMFTCVIPPGAFSGHASVAIFQPDVNQPVAVLEISPASKNGFKRPVTLIARMPGVEVAQLLQCGMSELNTSNGEWTSMSGALPNVQTMSVSTPLLHFSTYRVDLPTLGPNGGGTGGGGSGGDQVPGKQITIQE